MPSAKDLAAVVQAHLAADGIQATVRGDTVTIVTGGVALPLKTRIYKHDPKGGSVITEGEFRLKLQPREWGEIVQYHSGYTESEAEALAEVAHGWTIGVWPVVAALYDAAALARLGQPLRLTTTTDGDAPIEWRILVGPAIARCQHEAQAAVEDELRRTPPFTLLVDALADAVHQRRLRPTGAPHFGFFFASRLDGKPAAHEATLRGEPWNKAAAALQAFPWPATNAFMTFRQFFVIRDVATGRG